MYDCWSFNVYILNSCQIINVKVAYLHLTSHFLPLLRTVHTKDDNYNDNDKDIVLKIVLNIKE